MHRASFAFRCVDIQDRCLQKRLDRMDVALRTFCYHIASRTKVAANLAAKKIRIARSWRMFKLWTAALGTPASVHNKFLGDHALFDAKCARAVKDLPSFGQMPLPAGQVFRKPDEDDDASSIFCFSCIDIQDCCLQK